MPPLDPECSPFFILDHGLNPYVAELMANLGYPIRSVKAEFSDPPEGVKDPHIINYIADTWGFRGVWITKDSSSKRLHAELIRARRISVVWIQTQELATVEQHRIVTHIIPGVTQDLLESKQPLYYSVKFHGLPNREKITCKRIKQF